MEEVVILDLDEREYKEMVFAVLYARYFYHGTDGHNRLLLLAKMAKALDFEVSIPAELDTIMSSLLAGV